MARYLRKVIHAVLAVVFVGIAQIVPAHIVSACAAGLLAVFVGAQYVRALRPLRNAEAKSHGEFFFAIGIFVSSVLFLPTYPLAYSAAVLVLGFADSAAALIGIRYGTHAYHIFGERRTYEGSLTALIVSAIILYASGVGVLGALLGGWILAAVEALAPRGADNLALPVVAGALVVLFSLV